MKKQRIIPVVLFKDGNVVQSKTFSEFRNLGNPFDSIRRLSEWGADEVSFIDIGKEKNSQLLRSDLRRVADVSYLQVLDTVSTTSNMPLASGGQIKKISEIEDRLKRGADKVVINSASFSHPDFIKQAVQIFGSQCIVISIDVRRAGDRYRIYTENGTHEIDQSIEEAIDSFNRIEVGEIFLNSIDHDGTKKGLDLELVEKVSKLARVPLVVCGGAGKWEDFRDVLQIDGVDGVAAANIFQHIDQSLFLAHRYLYNNGANVRKPQLMR